MPPSKAPPKKPVRPGARGSIMAPQPDIVAVAMVDQAERATITQTARPFVMQTARPMIAMNTRAMVASK